MICVRVCLCMFALGWHDEYAHCAGAMCVYAFDHMRMAFVRVREGGVQRNTYITSTYNATVYGEETCARGQYTAACVTFHFLLFAFVFNVNL